MPVEEPQRRKFKIKYFKMSVTLSVPFGIFYSTRNNKMWNISTGYHVYNLREAKWSIQDSYLSTAES